MDLCCIEKKKDRRLLVLLALGGGILGGAWFSPGPQSQPADCLLAVPGAGKSVSVIRTLQGQVSQPVNAVQLSPAIACADTPPQLAIFFALPLPINQAGHAALTTLPGIGPRLADNILAYRRQHGVIAGPAALRQIDGIGNKMTEKLVSMVCFD